MNKCLTPEHIHFLQLLDIQFQKCVNNMFINFSSFDSNNINPSAKYSNKNFDLITWLEPAVQTFALSKGTMKTDRNRVDLLFKRWIFFPIIDALVQTIKKYSRNKTLAVYNCAQRCQTWNRDINRKWWFSQFLSGNKNF